MWSLAMDQLKLLPDSLKNSKSNSLPNSGRPQGGALSKHHP